MCVNLEALETLELNLNVESQRKLVVATITAIAFMDKVQQIFASIPAVRSSWLTITNRYLPQLWQITIRYG